MTQCSGWQSPGWSNPNLLVNWDFRNPVNQRGELSYIAGNIYVYAVDMVKLRNGTVNIIDGLINFVSTKDNTFKRVVWRLEKLKKGTYTMSALLRRKVISGGVRLALSNDQAFAQEFIMLKKTTEQETAVTEYITKTFTIESDKEAPAIEIICNNTTVDYCDIDIYAVKLEVGSISTLALDLMQPSDYEAELRKCQRYFRRNNLPARRRIPAGTPTTEKTIVIKCFEKMRTSPTVSFSSGAIKIGSINATGAVTTYARGNTFAYEDLGNVCLSIGTAEANFKQGEIGYMLYNDSGENCYIDFSAEL